MKDKREFLLERRQEGLDVLKSGPWNSDGSDIKEKTGDDKEPVPTELVIHVICVADPGYYESPRVLYKLKKGLIYSLYLYYRVRVYIILYIHIYTFYTLHIT